MKRQKFPNRDLDVEPQKTMGWAGGPYETNQVGLRRVIGDCGAHNCKGWISLWTSSLKENHARHNSIKPTGAQW